MQRTWKNKLGRALLVAILVALVVVFLYPLIFMALNSMKDKIEYYSNAFALPSAPTLDNYIALFNKFGIGRYLGNTLIISAGSLVLTLVCALFASYAFARMKFRGKSPAYLFIICTMFLPAQVIMIPLYVMYAKMGLINTYTGVILATTPAMLPNTILLLRSNFITIDKEIFEAAKLDGAGYFQIVKNILIPLGKPAIAISSIFNFLVVCNDLFRPMILLQAADKRTLTVALAALSSQKFGDPTYLFAGLTISALVPLIVYLIFSKSIVKGLTVGSIK